MKQRTDIILDFEHLSPKEVWAKQDQFFGSPSVLSHVWLKSYQIWHDKITFNDLQSGNWSKPPVLYNALSQFSDLLYINLILYTANINDYNTPCLHTKVRAFSFTHSNQMHVEAKTAFREKWRYFSLWRHLTTVNYLNFSHFTLVILQTM